MNAQVRVYARVRPFLPGDGKEEQEHPTINVNAHDESLLIAKRGDGKDVGRLLESHAFTCVCVLISGLQGPSTRMAWKGEEMGSSRRAACLP